MALLMREFLDPQRLDPNQLRLNKVYAISLFFVIEVHMLQ